MEGGAEEERDEERGGGGDVEEDADNVAPIWSTDNGDGREMGVHVCVCVFGCPRVREDEIIGKREIRITEIEGKI